MRTPVALVAVLVALLGAAPAADAARVLYFASENTGRHGGLDTYAIGPNSTLTQIGTTLDAPLYIASPVVTPDGRYLYVGSLNGTIRGYSIGADGTPTALSPDVTVNPVYDVATSPDGRFLYTAGDTDLGAFAIGADGKLTRVGSAVPTGRATSAVVSANGKTLFVTHALGGDIGAYPIGADGSLGTTPVTTPDGTRPLFSTMTPDGRFLYVGDPVDDTISGYAIGAGGTLTPLPGSPLPTFDAGDNLAASPAGGSLTFSRSNTGTVRAVSIAADGALAADGPEIPTGSASGNAAYTPDGRSAFVPDPSRTNLTYDIFRLDVATDGALSSAGPPVFTSRGPGAPRMGRNVVVTPDQGPTAAFTADAVLGGSPTQFNAGGSSDPDGTVARYDWDFGDGSSLPNGGPTPTHTYTTAGTYDVTLIVTDNEACSQTKTFTGQSVACNPSAKAKVTNPVQSLPHPLPVPGLSLTKVSANHYCIGPGPGAGSDIKISYTLSDPAKVTFDLQRRSTPVAAPRTVCPVRKPGGPGPVPVQFGGLGATSLDGNGGENFATVDKTGKTTAAAARSTGGTSAPVAKRKPLIKTLKVAKKGKQSITLRGAFGDTDLGPGWYRVLIHGVRADGSVSQFVAVKFWVLKPAAKRRR